MAGGGRTVEVGGECPCLDGLAVRHELKESQPSVTAAAAEAAADGLSVENQLGDTLSGSVFIHGKSHSMRPAVRLADMTADNKGARTPKCAHARAWACPSCDHSHETA